MSRKNMMHVISGSALGLTSVALAGTPDFDRAYAAELRADTAAHTSLLQAGGSGHDGAFHIGDGSGNNRLNVGGLLQFRWIYNSRDSADLGAAPREDSGMGFENHRTQLNFSGNVISPNWEYAIGMDFGSNGSGGDAFDSTGDSGSGSNVRDAWIRYNMEGDSQGTSLTFGQFVNPVMREDASGDAHGLAVERSVVSEFFSGGRTQGVMMNYQAEEFSISALVHDGLGWQGNGNPGAGTGWGSEAADFGVAARFDYKVEGDWAQFDDASSWKGSNNAFRIGAGLNYDSGGSSAGAYGGAPTLDATYLVWTVDAQYEGNGWNVSAAIIGNNFDDSDTPVELTNTGYVLQGGYFVQDDLELFGRYEMLDIDSDTAGNVEDSQSFVTVGGNYYLTPESHAAKVTVDLVWALDDAVNGTGTTGVLGAGDTGLAGGSDEEYVLRAQLQLVF